MVWIVLAIIVIIAALLYRFAIVLLDICRRGDIAMAKLEKKDRLYAQIDPKYYGGYYDYTYTHRRKQNSDDSVRIAEQQMFQEQVEEAARLASTGFEFGGWDTSPAQNPSQMNMNNNGFGF